MSEHKYLEICNIHPNPPPASVSENVSNILKANGGELVLVLLSFVKSGLSDQATKTRNFTASANDFDYI